MKPNKRTQHLLNLQNATKNKHTPSRYYFQRWINATLTQQKIKTAEITIRIVGQKESAHLNETYRHKPGATNVLSFPFAAPPGQQTCLLGDIVICAPVVVKEAKEQRKLILAHWAHMTLHGILHLLGYDHVKNKEAEVMEALEVKLLAGLGFNNPYEEAAMAKSLAVMESNPHYMKEAEEIEDYLNTALYNVRLAYSK